jgi:anti-sigma regulatory factor (Ser/Thr protein kinase)
MTNRRTALNLTLLADPRAVGRARNAVQSALSKVRPEVCQDVRLLVSELVTNSLRHGDLSPGDRVEVSLEATEENVHVEVADGGTGFDPRAVEGPHGTGGWGLFLVERLASRWGVHRNARMSVWFEVDRPFALAAG